MSVTPSRGSTKKKEKAERIFRKSSERYANSCNYLTPLETHNHTDCGAGLLEDPTSQKLKVYITTISEYFTKNRLAYIPILRLYQRENSHKNTEYSKHTQGILPQTRHMFYCRYLYLLEEGSQKSGVRVSSQHCDPDFFASQFEREG